MLTYEGHVIKEENHKKSGTACKINEGMKTKQQISKKSLIRWKINSQYGIMH